MNELSIEQSVQLAMQKHREGNLSDAEAIYRKVLTQNPNHPEVYFNFGLLLVQPGRLPEAAEAFKRAIALKPDFAQAHAFLGSVLRELGRLDEALAACSRAGQLKPDFAEAYVEQGNIMGDLDRLDEAVEAFRRAIGLKPELAVAHNNLGDAQRRLGRLDEALASCTRAIDLKADFAEAHNNLGIILHERKQFDASIAQYTRALQLNPNYAVAYNNLANAYCEKRDYDTAISAYARAIQLKPNDAIYHNNISNSLYKRNRLDEAIAHYQKAIQINPDYAEAHCSMAQAMLLKGDFRNGWGEYEWRWRLKPLSLFPKLAEPRWDGRNLNGRTILLRCEQGHGDILQFVRYAPMIAKMGGKVILECRWELARFMEQNRIVQRIVACGTSMPDFDYQCPIASLPLAFGTDLQSIPANVPYLSADSQLTKKWGARIGPENQHKKVGLVWAGSPDHGNDSNRSIPLNEFAPLADTDGVDFYSLQKGPSGKQAPPTGLHLTDWTDDLSDFADTAALLANLDLVITVDTAVAHLAGAMGKPVWLLLPFSPDWRWMLNRNDTPWYPTMRLFRQPSPGDWESVINRVIQQLKARDKV